MANKEKCVHRLLSLLGPENVCTTEEGILAKPASAQEIAGIIGIAAEENFMVEAPKYQIGPSAPPLAGDKIIISMERMNNIQFDPESQCLWAEPAVETGRIIQVSIDSGLSFPGKNCRHSRTTIGENVASCFKDGEPDFRCPVACLCGLELVLSDGSIVKIGDKSIKDFSNYQLSYIMGGYSRETSIISGIHLKLLPAAKNDIWLAVPYENLIDFFEVLPALLKDHRNSVQKVIAFKCCFNTDLIPALKKLVPSANTAESCVFINIDGSTTPLEMSVENITGLLSRSGKTDVFVATTDSHHGTALSDVHSILINGLKTGCAARITIAEQDWRHDERKDAIIAVSWEKEDSQNMPSAYLSHDTSTMA